MIVERDASGLFVINYWQTNQVTNNGGGGGRREWASLNTAKICRNSKLAKAETIPAQMRSCSSQGRRKTRAVRRVVMDRQLIDKLVERKTKFTPHPFFFLSVFGLFSSSWSCVIRLENIAKLASKKKQNKRIWNLFLPEYTTHRHSHDKQGTICLETAKRKMWSGLTTGVIGVCIRTAGKSPANWRPYIAQVSTGWMDGTKRGWKKRTNQERKKENERKMRERTCE